MVGIESGEGVEKEIAKIRRSVMRKGFRKRSLRGLFLTLAVVFGLGTAVYSDDVVFIDNTVSLSEEDPISWSYRIFDKQGEIDSLIRLG